MNSLMDEGDKVANTGDIVHKVFCQVILNWTPKIDAILGRQQAKFHTGGYSC